MVSSLSVVSDETKSALHARREFFGGYGQSLSHFSFDRKLVVAPDKQVMINNSWETKIFTRRRVARVCVFRSYYR